MSKKTAITPTRLENYSEWYQEVISSAELADNSPVRGCMTIRPYGYAIWESIQRYLDRKFKETGHTNAYFPLFIPLSFMEKEAEHIDGFATECAIVTHHKLTKSENGKLELDGKLEEPLVVRPTSETIIGHAYSKWIKSHKDLPVLINQWANVVRWEMRTRMFLRTAEILWQEGHTAHATDSEAMTETLMILSLYKDFAHSVLAMPFITGEKPSFERFPGALRTYTIEGMMQDKKALQAGTSHFLGQTFSKAFDIKFTNKEAVDEYVWTTSWGVTTRLIGAIIMSHSDDDGLVLPPRIAPYHIVILPILRNNTEEIISYAQKIKAELEQIQFFGENIRVWLDTKDIPSAEKKWIWVKKGAPIRLEIGSAEATNKTVCVSKRNDSPSSKAIIPLDEFVSNIVSNLTSMQDDLYNKATDFQLQNSKEIYSYAEFKEYFENDGGFAYCHALDDEIIQKYIKDLKITARCIVDETTGTCIFTGQNGAKKMVFAKAY